MDLSIRQGQFENLPKLPFVPGFECAGEIVYLGPNTTGHTVNRLTIKLNKLIDCFFFIFFLYTYICKIGERVICLPRFYAWSEYLVINCNLIYKIPDEINFRAAAALSYSYLTAYILLFELGGVKSGQTILFHSAGGGVGLALTQVNLKFTSNKPGDDSPFCF